jgi:hypothetical protein
MTETHSGSELDQPCRLGRGAGLGSDPEPPGRAPQQGRVADRFGRGDQDESLAVDRKRLELSPKALLDAAGERPVIVTAEPTGQLPGGEAPGELEQRERVTPCLVDDAVTHPWVEPARDRRLQQRPGVAVAQPVDLQLGQAHQVPVGAGLAHGEDHRDRLGQEAAGREGECLGRGPVEPLGVVDQADERPVAGGLGQQPQQGQADVEPVRRLPGGEAERGAERIPLGLRQVVQAAQHRGAQLLQPGERQLHLGLDPRRPGDPAPGRRPDEVVEQSGLADARLAPHDQHLALAAPDGRQETVQRPRNRGCACLLGIAVARPRGRSEMASPHKFTREFHGGDPNQAVRRWPCHAGGRHDRDL